MTLALCALSQSMSINVSGRATNSSGLRSAATPQRHATAPASDHQRGAEQIAAEHAQREPVSISAPNSHGPAMPPMPVPTA